MKKFLLTFGAAALALSSFAYERILFTQNFETMSDPAVNGWTTQGTLSLPSDDNGKYLDFYQGGGSGSRTSVLTWGKQIFEDAQGNSLLENGVYTVSFEFCLPTLPNKNTDSEITLFTNHEPIANNTYRLPWSKDTEVWENFVLDISQIGQDNTSKTMQVIVNAPLKPGLVEGGREVLDSINPKNLLLNSWYQVTATVDTESREVEYSVMEFGAEEALSEGIYTVPETNPDGSVISMYAEGLFLNLARAAGSIYIDNIVISCESSKAVANDPVVTLVRIGSNGLDGDDAVEDLAIRAYNITFVEGEVLHVTGTDGKTEEIEWEEYEGSYTYETTTSGNLSVWTTCEDVSSNIITTEVDCAPIVLPGVEAVISAVSDGYSKLYTLKISNNDVPLQPNIFIDYEYTGNKGEKVDGEDAVSGAKVSVSEEGSLKITAKAWGYAPSTVEVTNNTEFAQKKVWDFGRLTDEELKAAGFGVWSELETAKTSGFENWVARNRLYYYDLNNPQKDEDGNVVKDDNGNIVYNAFYPFGVAASNPYSLQYCVVEDNSDNTRYFDGLEIFDNARHVGMMKHIGLYNDETNNNCNSIVIKNIGAKDYVVADIIDNYGSNSNHPVCATADEYYDQLSGSNYVFIARDLAVAADENPTFNRYEGRDAAPSYSRYNAETDSYDLYFALFRIDTALNKLSIYSQVSGPVEDAVEGIEAEAAADNNWYTITGVRVAEPAAPGLYIHNGKKYIVK